MKRAIFIVVPSSDATGPVKGAHALANALCNERPVTLVYLKEGARKQGLLSPAVNCVSLTTHRSFASKVGAYARLLDSAGGRTRVASISMCLSADAINLACRRHALTCASVRGNLVRNYSSDYGICGVPVAMAHLWALRGMDHVVAMTVAMARQVKRYTGTMPQVISNFVDEPSLEAYRRTNSARRVTRHCIFLGSLTSRKQPLLALSAVLELRKRGLDVTLHIVGDGPLKADLERHIDLFNARAFVKLHGFQAQPYDLIAQCDALVLPSLSEGISRACLEALHLGVPCVLRDCDGNSELIDNQSNGVLFGRDHELPDALAKVLEWTVLPDGRKESLLPPRFRQTSAAFEFLNLVEGS